MSSYVAGLDTQDINRKVQIDLYLYCCATLLKAGLALTKRASILVFVFVVSVETITQGDVDAKGNMAIEKSLFWVDASGSDFNICLTVARSRSYRTEAFSADKIGTTD